MREFTNSFDPNVEKAADRLWKERGYEEYYLIEWEHLERPFPVPRVDDDAYCTAAEILCDAEEIIASGRK